MVKLCILCKKNRAVLKRPKTGQQICQPCFFYVFETEIHHTIVDTNLFQRGERVAIGASGGKGIYIYSYLCVMCIYILISLVKKNRFHCACSHYEDLERSLRLRP